MVAAQGEFGDEGRRIRSLGAASFGRNLRRLVPEDRWDQQPLEGAGDDMLLVADIRLDQREVLGEALGLRADAVVNLSDSALLLVAWERSGVKCIDQLRGDFAIAVYERSSGRLTLARSVLSAKELFFYRGSDFIAFASTIVGLAAVAGFSPRLNVARAIRLVAGLHADSSQTLFGGIEAVEQGHVVEGIPPAFIGRQFWSLERRHAGRRSRRELGTELRYRFEKAVQERLRRAQGGVASQMSAGRDSSAVTMTAARLLAPSASSINAYTAAPRIGFQSPEARHYLVDESQIAADATKRFPNINHHVVRPDAVESFADMDAWHRVSPFPIVDLPNFLWSRDIFRAAHQAGASVLLTGLMGNMALSAGGMHHLVDVLHEEGLGAWCRRARHLASHSTAEWPTLLNLSFGPVIPPALYAFIRVASGRAARRSYPLGLIRAPHRQAAREAIRAAHSFHELQPPKRYFDYRRDFLYTRDDSTSTAQALWGLDLRDPTADRDLIEFCFTLPPEELVGGKEPRPLFRAAFADELPDAIHRPARRGLQGADWYELFAKDLIAREWRESARHDQVRDLFDVAAIDALIDRWPTSGWHNKGQNLLYRNDVLGVISLANFIRHRF